MTESPYPYKIIPIWDRKLQTNALRSEIIEPQPRCRLRPRKEQAKQAKYLVDERPYHLGYFFDMFGYCVEASSCHECRICKKVEGQMNR